MIWVIISTNSFFLGGDYLGDLTDLTSTGASESGSHSHFMGRVIIVNRELKQFWWYNVIKTMS
jgi:hypothetical protein